jgi:2,4-dienoyl-CoA reductase-like NADH-dependent reductase (Old Yellow Enzyme family)
MLALTGELLEDGSVDHVDLVLEQHSDPRGIPGKPLSWVRGTKRNTGLLGLTGGFASGSDIQRGFDEGADLIGIGTAAILHPDFPKQLLGNSQFAAGTLPVSPEYLRHQGVTAPFLDYLRKLPSFVKPDSIAA